MDSFRSLFCLLAPHYSSAELLFPSFMFDLYVQLQKPGRVAQSVGHLTRKSEVLGSIPGSGHILSFLLPLIHETQWSVTGEVYARSTG